MEALLASCQIIIMDVSGADAAEQSVRHQFDDVTPDVGQTVAVGGVNPPEMTAFHQVVAGGQEDDLLSPDNPLVPPVQDRNAKLIDPYVATVPEFLPIPDAEDVCSYFGMMMNIVMMNVVMTDLVTMAVVTAVIVMPDFPRSGIPVMMMLLPRGAGDAEEQCRNQ